MGDIIQRITSLCCNTMALGTPSATADGAEDKSPNICPDQGVDDLNLSQPTSIAIKSDIEETFLVVHTLVVFKSDFLHIPVDLILYGDIASPN